MTKTDLDRRIEMQSQRVGLLEAEFKLNELNIPKMVQLNSAIAVLYILQSERIDRLVADMHKAQLELLVMQRNQIDPADIRLLNKHNEIAVIKEKLDRFLLPHRVEVASR